MRYEGFRYEGPETENTWDNCSSVWQIVFQCAIMVVGYAA